VRGGRVIDGSGSLFYLADVAIEDGKDPDAARCSNVFRSSRTYAKKMRRERPDLAGAFDDFIRCILADL